MLDARTFWRRSLVKTGQPPVTGGNSLAELFGVASQNPELLRLLISATSRGITRPVNRPFGFYMRQGKVNGTSGIPLS